MKKMICYICLLVLVVFNARAEEIKELPKVDNSTPLMDIMNKRKSSRIYSSKEVDLQALSEILWSAFGVNDRGTRTIPTALNKQNLKVFVVYEGKIWNYDGVKNVLVKVSDENVEEYIAKQDFVKNAPVNLIYTGSDKDYSYFHAGSATQNVSLYAASKGLNAIVRGYIDKEGLKNKLNLGDDEFVIINQVIGYQEN